MSKPGERIGAILSAEEGVVQFLGWGKYLGRVRKPDWQAEVKRMAPAMREIYQMEAQEPREVIESHVVGKLAANAHFAGKAEVSKQEIKEAVSKEITMRHRRARWSERQVREHLAKSPQMLQDRLVLDSGQELSGEECWWAPEADVRAQLAAYQEAGWQVVERDIDEARAQAAAQ